MLLVALLLLSPQRDPGGPNLGLASIQGRVQLQDDPDRTLEQVPVELRRSNGTPITTVHTSGNGQFLFLNLATGGYEVAVNYPGYQRHTEKVSISTASGRIHLQIHLRRAEAARPAVGGTVTAQEIMAPKNARREYEKALERLERSDRGAAERHLQKAVALHPTYARAWLALARLYNDLGRPVEALRAAARIEELSAGDALSHLEIARGLLGAGKVAEAEAAARRLDSEPHAQAPEVHLVLFQIAQSRQDKAGAAAELRRYLEEAGAAAPARARELLTRLEKDLAAAR